MKSHKTNALYALFSDIGGQIFLISLSFISVPIFVKQLSNQDYGIWIIATNIISWLTLSDFGLSLSITRSFIKIFNDQKNTNSIRNDLIKTAFVISLFIGICLIILGIVFYNLFSIYSKINVENLHKLSVLLFIIIPSLFIAVVTSIFTGVLEAYQKLTLNRNISTICNVINSLFAILFVIIFKNVSAMAFSLLLTNCIKFLVTYKFVTKLLVIKIRQSNFSNTLARDLLSFGGYFQLAKLADTMATNTDNFFISRYSSINFIQPYSITSKIYSLFSITLISKIPGSIFPGIYEAYTQGKIEQIRVVLNNLFNLLLRISILAASLIYFFNESFIKLWVGAQNYAGDHVNILIVLFTIYETIFRGMAFIIYIQDNMKNYSLVCFLEFLTNLILSVILGYKYGIIGIVAATGVSRFLTTGMYLFFVLYKMRVMNIFTSIKILFLSIPTIIFLFIIKKLIVVNSFFDLFYIILFAILLHLLFFDLKRIILLKDKSIKNVLYSLIYSN